MTPQPDAQGDLIRERMLALGVTIPKDQAPRLHFAPISVRQTEARLQLAIEEFLVALAMAGGNQVHLAERSLESPRRIRYQVARARNLGVDVDARVAVIMAERGITPWVQPPPPRPKPRPTVSFGPPVEAVRSKKKPKPKPKRRPSSRRPV